MKKFLVLLAEGFEEVEALTPVDYLRRAGLTVDTASISGERLVTGSHGVPVMADLCLDALKEEEYLGLYLPGGMPGSVHLRDDERVLNLVRRFTKENKIVSAICAAPIVLNAAGVVSDKKVTSFPSTAPQLTDIGSYVDDALVVQDGNIITGRGAAIAAYEAFHLIREICGPDVLKKVKEGIQQHKVEDYYGFES